MPSISRAHYGGDYKRRAAAVRVAAYADPSTVCWVCGLTLAEVYSADCRVRWQAGHRVDGAVGGVLSAEHSSCNASRGAVYGNQKREPKSRMFR